VLAVQAAGVLLEGALPRDRHRQDQSVERRVVESLANQLAGGQQDARRVWRQRFQCRQHGRALLLRRTALQRDQVLDQPAQGRIDCGEMLRALGQDQNLPPLQIGVDDLPDDAGRTSVIDRQCPEDLLDSGVGMHDGAPSGFAAVCRIGPHCMKMIGC
jgi:hypothetical protein